jgi:4-amino-4-deoxy-L-arabinose transferase-like glycosyltransferase
MKEKLAKNSLIILIILISSITLFYFFNANKGYWWDEAVYLGLAKNLYEGKGYFINFNQETFRPPLFPFIIYLLWKFFGVSELLVRLILPIFAILSVIILYIFVKKMYDKEKAIIAALILATSHMFIFDSLKILPESLFIFLSTLSLYFFYLAIELNKKKYFLFAGITMALSFLDRYPGLILVLFYLLYPLFSRKKTEWFKDRMYWLGIILFFVLLVPWFWMNQINFKSPVGSLFVEAGTVTDKWYFGEWYYYFIHWIEAFGLFGIFAIPGIIFLVDKHKDFRSKFILLIAAMSLLFFSLIPRKELRYLLHYFAMYIILLSVGISEFIKWMKLRKVILSIVIIFSLLNFMAGIQMIIFDMNGGFSLKDAGLYLKDIAPENTRIMSQNMPVLYYTTGKQVIYFPENETEFVNYTVKNNVSFVVIESREPTYPEYVWITNGGKKPSKVFENFTLEKTFEENNITYVWVYKVR